MLAASFRVNLAHFVKPVDIRALEQVMEKLGR